MTYISEHLLSDDIAVSISGCADDASRLLNLSPSITSPDEVVSSIDRLIVRVQREEVPADFDAETTQDLHLIFGSLWGEQLVRKLGWQWVGVTFHDRDEAKAVGVVSSDRSLVIYPFDFIQSCLSDGTAVTIELAFNMLVDGSSIPVLPPSRYEDVMANVRYIVPQE